jgi:hypothetical protein
MGLLDDAIREHLELKRKHGATDEEISRAEQEALAPARRDPAAGAGVPPLEHVAGEEPVAAGEPPPPTMPPADDAPPPPDLGAPLPEEEELPGADVGQPTEAFTPVDVIEEPDEPVADQPTQIRPLPPVDDTAAVPLGDEEDDYLAPEAGPPAHPPLESTEPIEEPPEAEPAPPPGTPKPHGDPAAEVSYDEEFDPDEVPADEALGSTEPPPADPYRARTSILDDPLREPPPPEPAPEGEQDVLEETPDFLQETPEHDKLWFEQKPPRDFDFD